MPWYYPETRPQRLPLTTPVRPASTGGGAPTGPAGGDLAGTYPNPTLAPGAVGTTDVVDGAITDAKITSVAYAKVTGAPAIPTTLPPSGPAGGDLTGTYPNPTIAKLNGAAVGTTTPLARGDLLVANATPALARMTLGASGTLLQSNGTDAVWAALPGAALWTDDATNKYVKPTTADRGVAVASGGTSGRNPVQWGTRTIKGRLVASGTDDSISLSLNHALNSNDVFFTPDDNTRPAWALFMRANAGGGVNDLFQVAHSAPGGGAPVEQMHIDGTGQMVLPQALNAVRWGQAATRGTLLAYGSGVGAGWAQNAQLNAPQTAFTQDDAAKSSWIVLGRSDTDSYTVARAAPGVTTPITLLTLDASGRMLVTADPTASLHLATKQYVDAHAGGPAGGDLTGTYPNPTIGALKVTTGALAAGAVTDAKVTDVAWGKITGAPASFPPSGAAGGDLSGSYPNPQIAAGTIIDADISATAAIQYSKLTGAPTTLPPSGAASGDLTGTYPSPTIAKLNGATVGTTTPLARGDLLVANATPALVRLARGTVNQVLQSNGTDVVWGPAPATGGPPTGTAGGSLAGSYPNPTLTTTGVTAATYGTQYKVAQITVNAEGRVTVVAEVTVRARWG
jgi:trimeric autotransporter adhesin